MKKRKTKEQIAQEHWEKEQRRIEKERIFAERQRIKKMRAEERRKDAEQRAWLRKQLSRPRIELPSAIPGESIFIHQRAFDGIMKQAGKKIEVCSQRVVGGIGGKLIIEYTTRHGGRGTFELNDLGPMPTH